jgi:hypothetical protein
MRKAIMLGSMAALGVCAQALAKDDLSYSYLEGGYISSESGGNDADGLNVFGSYGFAEQAHVFASYSDQEFDDIDVDNEFIQVGAGLNWTLAPKVDLIARLSYLDLEVGSLSDDGYGLGFLLRTRINDQFELASGFDYQDFDIVGENTQINIGGRYYFNTNLAGALDLIQSDGDTAFILGARYDFGQ